METQIAKFRADRDRDVVTECSCILRDIAHLYLRYDV